MTDRRPGTEVRLVSRVCGGFVFVVGSVAVAAWLFVSLSSRLNRSDVERRRVLALERRLASLVDATKEAIISTDLEGKVLTWNAGGRGAVRIFA